MAARAQIDLPGIAAGPCVVRTRIAVDSGTLGVGWLVGSTWIARACVEPAQGEIELELVVPAGTPGGALAFDNWTEDGRPARAVLRGIAVAAEDERTFARTAIRYLFGGRSVPSDHVADLERHFKLFPDFADLEGLVGGKPILRNFALNIW